MVLQLSKTLQIWLITAVIVELPIEKRFSIRNIPICGLWYGKNKPHFELFQIQFVSEVRKLPNVFIVNLNGQDVTFVLKIQAQFADLPAKAASWMIKQFNGKFGCPVCYHPGVPLEVRSLVRNISVSRE